MMKAASTMLQKGEPFVFPEIIKSANDKRQYRGLLLPNKVKVMLVSDPETDKSASAMSVAAGSLNDYDDLLGLAHFLEHMLFMGSEKYPVENDYDKFLTDHGGSSNAFTQLDHTVYYFDVDPEAFPQALDRFAQFFISPLFNESSTEREVHAVDSENEKNITSDYWRTYQLESSLTSKSHPFSRFTIGNLESLWTRPKAKNIDIRKELLRFHAEFYSANASCLALIDRKPLDELQDLALELFSGVKNKDIQIPVWPENPLGGRDLTKRIEMVPIKNYRSLGIVFPIPDTTAQYKSGSIGYITNLLGHEGEGSLHSLLKSKNWITSLSAYDDKTRGFAFLEINMKLTIEGLKRYEDIIEHFFQYIKMLREKGPQKWIWEELRDLNAMSFRFKDKNTPDNLVQSLVADMQDYPLPDVMSAEHILSEYKPDLIKTILDCLTPENCRFNLTSKSFEGKTNQVEEWYGIKYNYVDVSKELIEKWKKSEIPSELSLPKPNEFISSEFDLKTRDKNLGITPRIIFEKPLSKAWFLQDNEFNLPKAIIWFEAYSPLALVDPMNANLNALMVECLKDALTEFVYPASLAELDYTVSKTIYGQEIKVKGYNHKLPILLLKVLEKMVNFSTDEERFESLKDEYERSLKNWEDEDPYKKVGAYKSNILGERGWSCKEKLETMKYVTYEKVKGFAKDFCSRLHFEWLFYGNLTEEESLKILGDCLKVFENAIPLNPSELVRLREIKLPERCNFKYEADHLSHLSSCCSILLQTGLQNTREDVILELIHQIGSEPVFNILRTQEQLGYITYSKIRCANKTQGLQFTVQSDRHPAYVYARIENFIKTLAEMIDKMTDEEYLINKKSLESNKAEKPKKLTKRANLLIAEIVSQDYKFDRQRIELEELAKIEKKEVVDYFNEYIGPSAPKRKKLSIHVVSRAEGREFTKDDLQLQTSCEQIDNLPLWKSQQAFYPRPINTNIN